LLASITRPGLGAVTALTAVGGILRFVRLSHPPLLFDEAATYTRVVGSFRELVDILRFDGFAPLHYELYWLLARVTTLTPTVMRLIPALAGTAMIPAMYFLARQVASRRVATLASAITAFSAYLLVYSRDAKMYMHLWLFATLFVATLLWWIRGSPPCRRLAWLAWVAAASAMNGLHALGLCVVGAALVIVLTHPLLTKRKLTAALIGLTLSCSGLAGHYAFFNRWGSEIRDAGWRRSGLDWIGQRNREFSKPFLMWDTAASWLLAYRSPRPPIDPPKRVVTPVVIVSSVLGALLVAGALPWPRRLRDDDPDDAPMPARHGRGAIWMAAWAGLPCLGFAIVSFGFGKDVWNARYLAVVWPAVAILVAISIQRLPMPWLRAGAIAVLIGANLVQYGLRLSVSSAAPVDHAAADVAAAERSGGRVVTVVAVDEDSKDQGLGSGGGIFDYPGRYYLSLALHATHAPLALRSEPAKALFPIRTELPALSRATRTVIVWTDGPPPIAKDDPMPARLGPGWHRKRSDEHAVRDFWCWRRMFRCTRSEYIHD
jgi:4-amino-4-deoxy-L-arabinose transferase-like glycosyltransferase